MAITYTWEVTDLRTIDTPEEQNVVIQTYWKKIGTNENGVSAFFPGATPFKASTVAPGTFVPFDQLTQEIVLGWIQAVVVGSYETHVNNQIAANIDAKGVQTPPLPWAPPEPTPTEPIAAPNAIPPESYGMSTPNAPPPEPTPPV
jgi:hypothetical protein